jgi:hypothetical protein
MGEKNPGKSEEKVNVNGNLSSIIPSFSDRKQRIAKKRKNAKRPEKA